MKEENSVITTTQTTAVDYMLYGQHERGEKTTHAHTRESIMGLGIFAPASPLMMRKNDQSVLGLEYSGTRVFVCAGAGGLAVGSGHLSIVDSPAPKKNHNPKLKHVLHASGCVHS